MSSLAERYLHSLSGLLSRIVDEELPAIEQAGKLLADAVADGRRIFAFGCTHSSLPIQDLVYRAGGLALVNPVFAPGIASVDVHPANMSTDIERLQGYARVILDHLPIESGDVLIVVSVSGRNAVPIEMAQIAAERSIRVVGLTSRAYAGAVEARHPSGKKMHEFADVVLDNKVDVGDAVLEAEGMPARFCPASGVTSIAILQAVIAACVEDLLARGVEPPVFMAANVDRGGEHNQKVIDAYHDRIFYL